MAAKMLLHNAMVECPLCWQNFVHYIQIVVMNDAPYFPVPNKVFVEQLSHYNARVCWDKPQRVEFASDADKTHFMLRWS